MFYVTKPGPGDYTLFLTKPRRETTVQWVLDYKEAQQFEEPKAQSVACLLDPEQTMLNVVDETTAIALSFDNGFHAADLNHPLSIDTFGVWDNSTRQ